MRIRWRRVVVTILALAVVSPFCGVEVLYRWRLSRVGPLPRLPSNPHVGRVQRALWAAEEGGPMDVRPLWPWTLVAVYARALDAGELSLADYERALAEAPP